MKASFYILFLFLTSFLFSAQAQTTIYRGMVSVKENKVGVEDNVLTLNMDISLCGLSVGRYKTLTLIPMLRAGKDSVLLQPVVVNGVNKQKMYGRTLAFKGKEVADAGAYVVLKNDPSLIQQVSYKKAIPFQPWMKNAQLILVGEVSNYNGSPQQTFVNILTDRF